MFADVTARETGRHAAQRAAWLLGSTLLQGTLVMGLVATSLWLQPAVSAGPLPDIGTPVLIRPPSPRPPAPPVPPAPRPASRILPDAPRPPPSVLIQPREVTETASLDPGPAEPALPPGDGEPSGVNSGGFGPPAPASEVEDVSYVSAGFRAPAMASHQCVQRSVRVPRDLAGYVSGPVTVKFAIGRDATPTRFSVMNDSVPDRLAAAIWQAVQECRWVAGADSGGQPIALWVVMPLRFQAE